jgi:hypothetical protein
MEIIITDKMLEDLKRESERPFLQLPLPEPDFKKKKEAKKKEPKRVIIIDI